MIVRCVYCGAQEKGNEDGKCNTGYPHCFHVVWSENDRKQFSTHADPSSQQGMVAP